MLLDGIQCDGIVFKDAARLVMQGALSQLRFQLSYKLAALTPLLSLFPVGAEINLFGDDVEDDALIYAIFADLAAGRLEGERLYAALTMNGVPGGYAQAIVRLADPLPKREAVRGVYIRLVRSPDGARIREFNPEVVGWRTPVAVLGHLAARYGVHPRNYEAITAAAEPSEAQPGSAAMRPGGFWTPDTRRPD